MKRLLEEQGIFLDDTQLREVLKEIKSLAEAGNKVTSADAKAIAIKVINKKITA